MAKAPVKPSVRKPATPPKSPGTNDTAGVALGQVGKFQFFVQKLDALPDIPSPRTSRALPFKDWFGQMEHNSHVFVPDSFWTAAIGDGGREVPADKVDTYYVKSKVRNAFRDWQKGDESRKNRVLFMFARSKGDNAEGLAGPGIEEGRFTEPGMSIFIQIK